MMISDIQPTEYARAADDDGQLVGFIGVADGKIEMLFLDPSVRGQGGGKLLLNHALTVFGASALDVNEQNIQVVGFYLHQGFQITGRSALDSTGKPYPLLHPPHPAPPTELRGASSPPSSGQCPGLTLRPVQWSPPSS